MSKKTTTKLALAMPHLNRISTTSQQRVRHLLEIQRMTLVDVGLGIGGASLHGHEQHFAYLLCHRQLEWTVLVEVHSIGVSSIVYEDRQRLHTQTTFNTQHATQGST